MNSPDLLNFLADVVAFYPVVVAALFVGLVLMGAWCLWVTRAATSRERLDRVARGTYVPLPARRVVIVPGPSREDVR